MASEMSDEVSLSELGGENDGVPMSSASSISNDLQSELPSVMSETEDSNSYVEPYSSETDSYFGSGHHQKDDASYKSSSSDLTQASSKDGGDDGTGSGNSFNYPLRPGITWKRGERLEAEDYQLHWYPSKIMAIDKEKLSVLIHFEGWNQRYDEWVDMSSERLRPLTRHSERRGKGRRWKTVYRVGDQVLAKWTDCKMYLAKIDEVLEDGSYTVLFYDGFKKNIQPINLRLAPNDHKQPKFQIKPPVLSPKDLKNIKTKPVDFKVTDEKHASGKRAKKLKGKSSATPSPSSSAPATASTSATSHTSEKTPAKPPPHATSGPKKTKLIISGSLFSKKEKEKEKEKDKEKSPKSQQGGGAPKKSKEIVKVAATKVKPEVKAKEEAAEVTMEVKAEDAAAAVTAVGMEAGSQTYVPAARPIKKPPSKKRQRSGSFPGERRRRAKAARGPKPAVIPVAAIVKKAKSTDTDKPLESPVLLSAPLLPPVVPPKAFLVEEDHNPFKCDTCGKGFRKNQLLHDHLKHYHKAEGLHLTPAPPRKRKKTLSTCSTDSDMSVSSKSNSAKRRRHISEISVGSPDVAMKMNFDEVSPGSTAVVEETPLAEPPVPEVEEESSDEVVNCICGFREDTGTMIQCDCCQCWQHTLCLGYTDQDLASDTFLSTYICFVCKQPRGVRDSARYQYDMDWFRKGRLPRFNFINQPEANEEQEKEILATHGLAAEILAIQKVMHGLREEIALTGEKEHPELRLWHPQPAKELRTIGISTSDNEEQGPTSCEAALPADSCAKEGETRATKDTASVGETTPPAEDKTVGRALGSECMLLPSGVGETKPEVSALVHEEKNVKVQPDDETKHSAGATDTGVKMEPSSDNSVPPTNISQPVPSNTDTKTETASVLEDSKTTGSVEGQTVRDESVESLSLTGIAESNHSEDSKNQSAAEKVGIELEIKDEKEGDKLTGGASSKSQNEMGVTHTAAGKDDCENKARGVVDSSNQSDCVKSSVGDTAQGESVPATDSKCVEKVEDSGTAVSASLAEVKVEASDSTGEQAAEGAPVAIQRDPFFDCKLSVLSYVRTVQDDLSHQLDVLEQQIGAVERQEFGVEAAGCFSTIPALKHSLYRLARDLNKVKAIAAYR